MIHTRKSARFVPKNKTRSQTAPYGFIPWERKFESENELPTRGKRSRDRLV